MNTSAPSNGQSPSAPFLKRVRIRNYKSLVDCDVELGPLTVLVGRNGAGKSNFLDALKFVSDALRISLDHAVRSRGGFGELKNKGSSNQEGVSFEFEIDLGEDGKGDYAFELSSKPKGGVIVEWERLKIEGLISLSDDENILNIDNIVYIDRVKTKVNFGSRVGARKPSKLSTRIPANRLGLASLAEERVGFTEAHDAFLAMDCFNFSPSLMKALQRPESGELLASDGGNIASVIGLLSDEQPDVKARIDQYLSSIVEGVTGVNRVILGPWETLAFERTGRSGSSATFYADSMSDGTLQALGALVAVNQLAEGSVPVRLVGIEEPEAALHPAASGVLMDALREAAVHTQVVVTTHSPDLLDQIDPDTDRLLVVQSRNGETEIGPIDPASRKAIREHLFTPGELLRMDQLELDQENLKRQRQVSVPDLPGHAE